MGKNFKICVLISGGGTTLKNLIEKRVAGQLAGDIIQVVSSKPDVGGLQFAHESGIPSQVINFRNFDDSQSFSRSIFDIVRNSAADLVVLGGFLRKL